MLVRPVCAVDILQTRIHIRECIKFATYWSGRTALSFVAIREMAVETFYPIAATSMQSYHLIRTRLTEKLKHANPNYPLVNNTTTTGTKLGNFQPNHDVVVEIVWQSLKI